MGRELLIIALNGDSVVAEGTTHYPATLLNHLGKWLALHTHAFAAVVCERSTWVSFVYILNLLEAWLHSLRRPLH